ncbi:SUMO-specific isopeptidase USPL1 [Caerostris darwini]|uniref:SUMO-specific isopeptidase USPL1 n=1 Tax=Caerostris darwini TaxID=1538125 RepID=A0AAV4M9P5_9ARAC|nr:SUMO-specific isopeptidase USPL1 [Caerostris darwini]
MDGKNEKKSSNSEKSNEVVPLERWFPMWRTNLNSCWLDSAMILLAHNGTLWNKIKKDPKSSLIANIICNYKIAIRILNSAESIQVADINKVHQLLDSARKNVFDYLKVKIGCVEGIPDSAFCALLNILKQNKEIENVFMIKFDQIIHCQVCGLTRVAETEKTIISFPKIKHFNPYGVVKLIKCPACTTPYHELRFIYKTLPRCLIFHFENGAGSGVLVRHGDTDKWMDYDNLKARMPRHLSFAKELPYLNLETTYILIYEANWNSLTKQEKPTSTN